MIIRLSKKNQSQPLPKYWSLFFLILVYPKKKSIENAQIGAAFHKVHFLQLVGGSLIGIFTSFILTVVYIFCILYYRNHIKNFVLRLSKKAMESECKEKVIYNVTQVSQQYLIGLMKMIGLLWVRHSIGFSIIGVKNALFFAVICSFLEIVPFIGNITGTTFTVFVTAAQGGSLTLLIRYRSYVCHYSIDTRLDIGASYCGASSKN